MEGVEGTEVYPRIWRSRSPSNSILIAHAADLSVREIHLDHILGFCKSTAGKRSQIVFRKFNECVPDPRTGG